MSALKEHIFQSGGGEAWGAVDRRNAEDTSKEKISKNLQAINAGEGVEKREPSYTVGGNAN